MGVWGRGEGVWLFLDGESFADHWVTWGVLAFGMWLALLQANGLVKTLRGM